MGRARISVSAFGLMGDEETMRGEIISYEYQCGYGRVANEGTTEYTVTQQSEQIVDF